MDLSIDNATSLKNQMIQAVAGISKDRKSRRSNLKDLVKKCDATCKGINNLKKGIKKTNQVS